MDLHETPQPPVFQKRDGLRAISLEFHLALHLYALQVSLRSSVDVEYIWWRDAAAEDLVGVFQNGLNGARSFRVEVRSATIGVADAQVLALMSGTS